MNYLEYIHHIGEKLLSILHTVAGWIVMLVLLLVDYIAGLGYTTNVGTVTGITMNSCAGA